MRGHRDTALYHFCGTYDLETSTSSFFHEAVWCFNGTHCILVTSLTMRVGNEIISKDGSAGCKKSKTLFSCAGGRGRGGLVMYVFVWMIRSSNPCLLSEMRNKRWILVLTYHVYHICLNVRYQSIQERHCVLPCLFFSFLFFSPYLEILITDNSF